MIFLRLSCFAIVHVKSFFSDRNTLECIGFTFRLRSLYKTCFYPNRLQGLCKETLSCQELVKVLFQLTNLRPTVIQIDDWPSLFTLWKYVLDRIIIAIRYLLHSSFHLSSDLLKVYSITNMKHFTMNK